MAKVEFYEVNLDDDIAHMPEVRAQLVDHADDVATAARLALAAHRKQGHARITRSRGELDEFVNLEDSDGDAAAIEFGRQDYVDPDTGEWWGGMSPLFILSDAARIKRRPIQRKLPKARRKPTRGKTGWIN